ncbi:hypothetical protein [Streptomyces sp. NPDC048157]
MEVQGAAAVQFGGLRVAVALGGGDLQPLLDGLGRKLGGTS